LHRHYDAELSRDQFLRAIQPEARQHGVGMPSACKQRKCRLAAAENGVGARTGAIHIREAIACMKTDRAFAKAAVRGVVASLVGAILCFTASASAQEPLKLADSQLEPVKWTELASWRTDDHLAAFAAYRTSCQALRKVPRTDDHRPIHEALGQVHDSQVVEEVLNTPRSPLDEDQIVFFHTEPPGGRGALLLAQ
jgi:hypothetical protein